MVPARPRPPLQGSMSPTPVPQIRPIRPEELGPRPTRAPALRRLPGEGSAPPRTAEGERPVEALLTRLRTRITGIFSELEIPNEDAEDLLQETLFVLFFKWDGIRKPEAWLLSTLRNRCLIYRRKLEESFLESVDPEILAGLAGAEAPPQERAELRHDLAVAFARLPERYRDVLRLRYGLGCESSEVAERLGYGAEGMRRLTSRSLVSLGRELRSVGVTRESLR